jgi:hypothetical protein
MLRPARPHRLRARSAVSAPSQPAPCCFLNSARRPDRKPPGARVEPADSRTEPSRVVVAADGLPSVARRLLGRPAGVSAPGRPRAMPTTWPHCGGSTPNVAAPSAGATAGTTPAACAAGTPAWPTCTTSRSSSSSPSPEPHPRAPSACAAAKPSGCAGRTSTSRVAGSPCKPTAAKTDVADPARGDWRHRAPTLVAAGPLGRPRVGRRAAEDRSRGMSCAGEAPLLGGHGQRMVASALAAISTRTSAPAARSITSPSICNGIGFTLVKS